MSEIYEYQPSKKLISDTENGKWRVKEKIVAEFWDNLKDLKINTAKKVVQKAIDSMKIWTKMKTQYESQWSWLIIAVQILLKEKGYDIPKLDWIIWKDFNRAVVNFQIDNKLDQDGQAWSKTLTKILSTDIKPNNNKPADNKPEKGKKESITIDGQKYDIVSAKITFWGKTFDSKVVYIDNTQYIDCENINNFTGKWFDMYKNHKWKYEWDIYYWDYKNNTKEGKWIQIRSNWDKYIWEFKGGLLYGNWILKEWKATYSWVWNGNNLKTGIIKFSNWSKYEWDSSYGEYNVKWTYTNSNNIVFSGRRNDGKLILKSKKEIDIEELDKVKTVSEANKLLNS